MIQGQCDLVIPPELGDVTCGVLNLLHSLGTVSERVLISQLWELEKGSERHHESYPEDPFGHCFQSAKQQALFCPGGKHPKWATLS